MGVLVRSLISSMIAFMALGLMFSLVALAACIVARSVARIHEGTHR
jgi:hypothetical protein